MAITIKSEREIQIMREAGRMLAKVHEELAKALRPGMTTMEIDRLGEELIRSFGCIPSFKGYNGYPGSVCVSVNEEVVHGIPSNKSGKISNWLLKNPDTNTVSVYHSPHRGALEAHSLYRVLKSSRERDMSLVEVELLTGRTHQIRAQFADMGHPLVGDGKYGINRDDKKIGFKFQALYSYKLTFMPKDELSPLAYLKGREFSVKEVFFKDEI